MTGFGRTGTTFAVNQTEAKPDLICLSKGLSAELYHFYRPCTNDIFDAFLGDDIQKAFLHGHSFTGNPIGCTAAIASLDLLERKECQRAIKNIAESHEIFSKRINSIEIIKDIRQTGTILAIELSDSSGYASSVRHKLYQDFLDQGVLLRPLETLFTYFHPTVLKKKN